MEDIEIEYNDLDEETQDICDRIIDTKAEFRINSIAHESSYFLDCATELGEITDDVSAFVRISNFNFDNFLETYPWVGYGTQACCNDLRIEYDEWYKNIATPLERVYVGLQFIYSAHYQLKEITDHVNDKIITKLLVDRSNNVEAGFTTSKIVAELERFSSLYSQYNKSYNNLVRDYQIVNKKDMLEYIKRRVTGNIRYFEATHPWFPSDSPIVSAKRKKAHSDNLKKAKSVVKKSLKLLTKVIGEEKTVSFIKGDTITLQGKLFDYKVTKHNNILYHSYSTSNGVIPYRLDIYEKDTGHELCSACVYLVDTPVLDQVIALSLYIKGDAEEEFLKAANLFARSDHYYQNDYIQLIKDVKPTREEDFTFGDLSINLRIPDIDGISSERHRTEVVPWRNFNRTKILDVFAEQSGIPKDKLQMIATFDFDFAEIYHLNNIDHGQFLPLITEN